MDLHSHKIQAKELWLVFLVLAMGIGLRSLSLLAPYHINDEACVVMEGWNIQRGELPIFFYGQAFQGTIEGYLAAFLFTLFRSHSLIVVGMIALTSSALFLIFFFLLVNKVFGKNVALVALLFAALGPPMLVQWGHDIRLHYSLVVAYQSLLFLLALKVVESADSLRRQKLFIFLLGSVAGLAWWTNYLNVHSLIVAALFLVWHDWWMPLRLRYYWGLVGFFVGSLPLWIFNFTHHFQTLKMGGTFRGFSFMLSHLPFFFKGGFTRLLGVHDAYQVPGYAWLLWSLTGIWAAAAVYYLFFQRPAPRGKGLFLGVIASGMLITSATPFWKEIPEGGDYLLPMIPPFLVVLALFVASLRKKAPLLYGLFIFAFVGNNLAQNYFDPHKNLAYFNPVQAGWLAHYNYANQRFMEILRRGELTRIYVQSAVCKLNFLGDQKFIFSNFYQDSYPPNAERVDATNELAILTQENEIPSLDGMVHGIGAEFKRELAEGHFIYSDFKLKRPQDHALDCRGWKAESSPASAETARAFDRLANSRWSSGSFKKNGMWFLVDLGKIETVDRVALYPGHWEDYPGGLSVEVSLDKKRWKEAARVPEAFGPFYWDGAHPFFRVRRGRSEVAFEPVKARYFRLTQLGNSSRFYWSISELYLYGPNAEQKPEEVGADAEAAAAWLKKNPVKFLAADPWLSARIKIATDGKIRVYPFNLFTGVNREQVPEPNKLKALYLTLNVAVAVSRGDEAELENLLQQSGIRAEKIILSHYILYGRFEGNPSLPFYWNGAHLLKLEKIPKLILRNQAK